MDELKTHDKSIAVFDKAWHYLFMEPCKKQVMARLFEWVDSRSAHMGRVDSMGSVTSATSVGSNMADDMIPGKHHNT